MRDAALCPQCGRTVPAEGLREDCLACSARTEFLSDAADQATVVPAEPSAQEAVTTPPRVPSESPPQTLGETDAPPNQVAVEAAVAAALGEVPGYEVLDELGRGGMGVVYKARHKKLGRLVALKMILAGGHAGEAELARFRTEAEAIARVKHVHVVQIYEIGEHEGKPYFSLEYCPEGSLSRKIAGTPMQPREAAELVERLARGIDAAHRQNVIHRDLKPANVLIVRDEGGRMTDEKDEDGSFFRLHPSSFIPKITDFGLAKKLDDASQTQSGVIMGTPSYMAPEQAAGKAGAATPATDIYSLGAILYELLTGRPPFRAATPLDTILQVVANEPVRPSHLQSKMPRDIETICLKCLAKEPGKRYASAASLADDLGRFRRGEPILARPVGGLERAEKWVRRRPVVAALIGAIVVVAAVGVGAFAWAFGETARALKDTKDALAEVAKQRKTAEDNWARAEWRIYVNGIMQAQNAWNENNVAAGYEYLAACRPELRGWEHDYLFTLFNRNQRTFKGHFRAVTCVAFSGDGERIVSGSRDDTVRVWDAATGQETLVFFGHKDVLTSIAFSPDGKHIVSASLDKTVKVWNASTGQETLTLKGHTLPVTSASYSGDGQRILTGSADNTVKVWDAATGREALTLQGHTDIVTSAAFSNDGQRIVSGSRDQTVKLWDPATGRETFTFRGHGGAVESVAFSSDSKKVASGGADKTVKVWDVASLETLTLTGHTRTVQSVSFSGDGKRVVSGGADNCLKVWDAVTGQEIHTLKGHTDSVAGVSFSRDGKWLASGGDMTVRVWDAALSQNTLTLKGHADSVTSVAFSGAGQRLVSGSVDKTAKVWDALTGQEIAAFAGHADTVTSVSFSGDGQRIASGGARDKLVKVWEAATGKEIFALKGHDAFVANVAFSGDGQRIVSGGDDMVKVWDAAAGREIRTLTGHANQVSCAAFTRDGRHIVSGSTDGKLKVWDAATGREELTLAGHIGMVLCVSFSEDGQRIVSGAADKDSALKVWDRATGQEIMTLSGHKNAIMGVAFSPDGKRIVSGSRDKTVKVWDAATGQETITLREHTDAVTSVAFSADGKRIVSASADKTIKVWDASVSQPR
jgi:WD40 repeat protein/tRNA A-37 threonylcarbamoyl transferase component Bud32